MTILIHEIFLKMVQMNLFTKQIQTHRLREGSHGCQREVWEEGIVREFEIDISHCYI